MKIIPREWNKNSTGPLSRHMHEHEDEFRASLIEALPVIRRYAFALSNSMTEADDLLQATMERALNRRAQFQAGTKLQRWLFKICRNIWIDEMRYRKTKGNVIELTSDLEPAENGEFVAEAKLTLSEVDQAMASLPAEFREVMMMVGVQGYAYRETAEILDIPIGTVMSRLARARAFLADAMDIRKEA